MRYLTDLASGVTVFGLTLGGAFLTSTNWAGAQDTNPGESVAEIQFIDSATGFAIRPESITAQPDRAGGAARQFLQHQFSPSGRVPLVLEKGPQTLSVSSSKYQSMSVPMVVQESSAASKIKFLLDPVERPEELRLETVRSLLRDEATLFQGFVGDEESGQPLSGVSVRATPSGVQTATDARGFFRLYVPVERSRGRASAPVALSWEKPGYRGLERRYLEVWSRGDTTYTLRLEQGNGRDVIDQRTRSRNSSYDEVTSDSTSGTSTTRSANVVIQGQQNGAALAFQSLVVTNPMVRVPRNIRVLEGDGTYWYVTFNYYLKNTLPSEWIRSWHTNSLNAGSVAVSGYAINRINTRAADSTHDICGTSDCQNFDPGDSSTATDAAVDYTINCVMVDSNNKAALTEYAAENNSLGLPCGDGYTAPYGGCLYDPLCAGKARDGHGRGMCQRGSNRWATNSSPHEWTWILQHYYPDLFLVRASVLVIGDNVVARTANDCEVRMCGSGGISSGTNCTLITTRAAGDKGVIIDGPHWITNANTGGFTWYKVQWSDSVVGWSCENFLDRDLPSTITKWNFNSTTNDGNTATGVTTPAIGAGTMTLTSVTANGFNDGSAVDPASLGTDNSSRALQGPSNSGVANKTGGPKFAVSTANYTNIVVSFELWTAGRASAYWRGQYTTNGTTWVDHLKVDKRTAYVANGGATFTSHFDDLSGVAGVANNTNFAYRVVAEYQSTATGSGSVAYVATDPNDPSGYSNTGPFRVDLFTIAGTAQ